MQFCTENRNVLASLIVIYSSKFILKIEGIKISFIAYILRLLDDINFLIYL